MPTATEFFGISARNLGPLTTTYTAPSSCATDTAHRVFANATSPYDVLAMPSCSWAEYGDCIPSAKPWESSVEQTGEFYQGTSVFFSPGLACPAGWKTVGLLAHTESGKFSASGALATPAPTPSFDGFPEVIYATNYWKKILDESETLAYCCPSGFGGNVRGECVSTLGPVSSYTYSEFCQVYGNGGRQLTIISTVDGVTNTEGVFSIMEPTRTWKATSTSMIDVEELQLETGTGVNDIVIASWVPAVPLVYKKSDMDKNEDSDDSETSTATSTGGSGESGESGASTVPRQGVVSVLGLALGLLASTGMLFS